jgi:hypothetical protein
MKVQGLGLVRSFKKKEGNKSSDSGCKVVRAEVMLEDVGVGKNGARTFIVEEYYLTCPRPKLRRRHL